MSENSAISWTDHTFNPWVGCTKVSPACNHCYAERWAKRAGKAAGVVWGGERRRTAPSNWAKPLKWNDQAEREGRRFRVFCSSLADVFDNKVPAEWLADLLALINATPSLDWLLLTKRIGNFWGRVHAAGVVLNLRNDVGGGSAGDMAEGWIQQQPPENVWLGATICNQEEADRDIGKLMDTPAAVRFLSIEPMLGAIDLGRWLEPMGLDTDRGLMNPGIDWVIVGGESGPNARPMHPDWARSLRDQCAAAGVPFHFKQWGEWLPWSQFSEAKVDDPPEQTNFRTLEYFDGRWDDVGRPGYIEVMDGMVDDEQLVGRVGVKAAGRLLDGALHDAFPETDE